MSSTRSDTQNVDNRVTTGEGDILSLSSNTLTVNEGGQLTVVNKDPEAAYRAIAAMETQTQGVVNAITNTAATLAQGSNAIAQKVSESQAAFVETASGQKYVLYVVAGLAAVLVLPLFLRSQKS